MESITLTVPVSSLRVLELHLDWEESAVNIVVGGPGFREDFLYTGAAAMTLMVALNKLDLSVKSLHRRVLERLIADGKLAGSVVGIPD
jgi:hypothetical protein